MYPTIQISGGPRDRGRQYGEAARTRIARCRDGYAAVFADVAGLTWAQTRDAAMAYHDPITRYAPAVELELRGIAEGADLDFEDVLALNVRTEIIWAATANTAATQRQEFGLECTAFGLLGPRTANHRLVVGQTWDWLVQGFDTVVVLEVEQPDDEPNFVTVVEAGLLAKSSLNSSGLAVCTNTLVTEQDCGRPGVPYHVLLRMLANCATVTDAITTIQSVPRASSANYLLGHADDTAIDVETAPGDYRGVSCLLPDDHLLLHTNHFLNLPPGADELSVYAMPDSIVRLARAQQRFAEQVGPWSVEQLRKLVADHGDWPHSLCCHPDPRQPETRQWATVMSVVIEPAARQLWLASGNPCQHEFELLRPELLQQPTTSPDPGSRENRPESVQPSSSHDRTDEAPDELN